MGFLKNVNIRNTVPYSFQDGEFMDMLGINPSSVRADKLGETCYITILRTLSESVSKAAIKVMISENDGEIDDKKHYLNTLLCRNINPYMTPVNFFNTCELLRNHYGNCIVYIQRNHKGRVQSLWILKPENVSLIMDDKGLFGTKNKLYYHYTDEISGQDYVFTYDEVLHFKSVISFNGIVGLSIKDILKKQIETRKAAQNYLHKNYTNDMVSGKIAVQYTGDLNDPKAKNLVEKLELSKNSSKSGAFITISPGIELKPLQVNLTDGQFRELQDASALEISAAFGIRDFQLNRDSKYNTVELQQTDFYINSMLPIFKMYEQELTRKLFTSSEIAQGYYIDFNTDELMKGDFASYVNTISQAVDKGLYTPNEGRRMLKKPKLEGCGNTPMVNGSYTPLSSAEKGLNYNKNGGGDAKSV